MTCETVLGLLLDVDDRKKLNEQRNEIRITP